MSDDKKNETWAHCNPCNRHTRHDILFTDNVETEDGDGETYFIAYWDDYSLLKCRGCNAVHLKHDSSFSEDTAPDGKPNIHTTIYPPRISRKKPGWLNDINGPFLFGETEVEQLLEEVYIALHNNSLRLAAMGLRALVEFIMIDKVGDKGSIGENIKAFFAAGYVAQIDQQTFKGKLIDAGNAAMHRGYKPNTDDLATLLDLAESLVASIYVHPVRVKKLEKRIPARAKK